MSAVVVRCPACRGASQVGPDAVGLLVACPRCQEPFLAIEEAAPIPQRPVPSPLAPPESGDRSRPPLRPRSGGSRNRSRRPRGWAEPVAPPDEGSAGHPAPDHLHSDLAPGGLPLSVMIGFALLPFAIPLMWVAALLLTGQPPALSIATPVSLAASASVLCLAVVFTVDWSPATRLKGVLMLVGLAYFAGFSLFFLKKDMVDRVKQALTPQRRWKVFEPHGQGYRVKLPAPHPRGPVQAAPLRGWNLVCFSANHQSFTGATTFIVAAGKDRDEGESDVDRWFQGIEQTLIQGQAKATDSQAVTFGGHPGRQWRIEIQDNDWVRVIRVYRANNRIYYLSAEGPNIDPDDEDDLAHAFFRSFEILAK